MEKIYNPLRPSQANIPYEDKIVIQRNKIKWNIALADQAKAYGLNDRSQKLIKQAEKEEKHLEALIMSNSLAIPRELFHHGK